VNFTNTVFVSEYAPASCQNQSHLDIITKIFFLSN